MRLSTELRGLAVDPLPTLSFQWKAGPDLADALTWEWLSTNGLGGYASSSMLGCNTRRYHALLVASLPSPFGRVVLLPRVTERIRVDEQCFRLDAEEHADGLESPGRELMRNFRLRGLVPEWEFQVGPTLLRRRLFLVHRENTVFVTYENLDGREARLELRPFCTFRGHDWPLPKVAPEP